MLYAELRRTGKIIPAAKASPYGNYRCPTCKAGAFLKAGQVYIAHFAHMPGQGRPECDDYHPPEDLRRQWLTPSAQPSTQKIDGLLLSIELEPDHDARHGLRRWGLRLTVPKSYDSHGEIRIDLGGGDVRRVSLTTLLLGGQTYRADPAAVEFGAAWVSPEVRPEYRQAVEHRIAGLNPVHATVFAAVPQRLKPRCGALRWGESYYFVWRDDRSREFPSSLLHHALADNRGWACCLVALPDKVDSDIAAWLEKTSDLQVVPARREWALIHPAPYGVDDDAHLQIHSAATLLLAIKPVDDDGEITCISGQQSASLQLSGAGLHVVEICVGQQTTPQPIQLTWDSLLLNSLAAQAYPKSAPEPAVVVEFGLAPHKTHVALHHASCQARLLRVRTAEEQISDIHADSRLRGKVRFRSAGEFEWQSEELNFSRPDVLPAMGHTSLPTTQIARLNGLLKDRSLDVTIDFGPYGVFFAIALAAAETARPNGRIPRRLRARIEWLCKASRAFVDAERRPVSSLDDAALLRHLSTLKIPVSLLANLRALERDLHRTEGGLPA